MNDNKKISFFQKIILAISDFRFYPYIIKTEKLSQSIGYFLVLVAFMCVIITGRYASNLFQKIDDFILHYDDNVPDFSLVSGILNVSETLATTNDDGLLTIVDTTQSFAEYINSSDYKNYSKYDQKLLINSDRITFETGDGNRVHFLFSNIEKSYDKDSLITALSEIYYDPITKIVISLFIFVILFVSYFLVKTVEIIFFSLMASVVAAIFGIKIDYKNYLKIAIYIVTLPYLIETLAILIVGTIKDYAVITSNILSYVYIFYAIRAIKLDAFLLIMNSKRDNNKDTNNDKNDKDGGIDA